MSRAAYMREYRLRPGNMAKHNAQTREWKRRRRLDQDYVRECRLREQLALAAKELPPL